MIEYETGAAILLELAIADGAVSLAPTAEIRTTAGALVGVAVALAHVNAGLYQGSAPALAEGEYSAHYLSNDPNYENSVDQLRVVAPIETQVWDAAQASHVAAGSFGQDLDASVSSRATQAQILSDAAPFAGADVAAILADTASIQPTVAANLDASVSSRATQAQILSDATPFAGANVDAAISTRSSHNAAAVDAVITASHGAGAYATAVGFAVPGDGMALTPAERTAIDGVLAAAHGAGLWDATASLTEQQVRDAMKLAPSAGVAAAGSVDVQLDDILADTAAIQPTVAANLDVAVSSRSSHSAADVDAAVTAAHGAGAYAAATGFAVPGDAMALTPVERTTLVNSMLNEPTAGHVTAGTVGKAVADGALHPTVASIVDGVWNEPIAGHLVAGSTGLALNGATAPSAGAVAAAVWDEALPGAHAAGTAGERLATTDDRVDAAISTRSSHGAADVDALLGTNHGVGQWDGVSDWNSTELAQIRGALGIVGIQAPPAGGGELQDVLADTAAMDGRLPTDPADESNQTALHATTQADIAALNDLSQAGVQAALTTQGYTAGRAPSLDNLDAAVSSRAAPGAAMALIAGAVNSTSLVASAGGVVADSVWDEARAAHAIAGSFGEALDAPITSRSAAGDAMALTGGERALVADSVWDEPIAGHLVAGSTGLALNGASAPSAAVVADAVWDELRAAHIGAGSFGEALDAQVSSRATQAQILSDATPFVGANLDAAVSSRAAPTDPMTLTAGERSTVADAVWDESLPGAHAAGTAGERLATTDDRVDAAVTTRAAPGDAMGLAPNAVNGATLDATASGEIATAVWEEPIAGHLGVGKVGRSLDEAANAVNVPPASAIADATWDELRAAHIGAGSFGEALDAQVSSRAVPGDAMDLTAGATGAAAGAVWDESLPGAHAAGTAGERLATTDDRVDAQVSSRATQAQILSDATPFAGANVDATVSSRAAPGAAMGLVAAALDSAALADDARDEIAAAVWDALTAAHAIVGSFGAAITAGTATAIAGAVWGEVLNGHLAVGSAGEALKAAFAQAGGDVRDDALTYDANDRPLTIRRRIFPDAATALASTVGGTGEGEVMTFTYVATHTSPAQWESLVRRRTA